MDNEEYIKYLRKRYFELDEQYEKAKGRRFLFTYLGFVAVIFFCLMSIAMRKDYAADVDFGSLLMGSGFILLFSAIFGGILFLITFHTIAPLCIKGLNESKILKDIKQEVNELEGVSLPRMCINPNEPILLREFRKLTEEEQKKLIAWLERKTVGRK